jgi:hypothetical protein
VSMLIARLTHTKATLEPPAQPEAEAEAEASPERS